MPAQAVTSEQRTQRRAAPAASRRRATAGRDEGARLPSNTTTRMCGQTRFQIQELGENLNRLSPLHAPTTTLDGTSLDELIASARDMVSRFPTSLDCEDCLQPISGLDKVVYRSRIFRQKFVPHRTSAECLKEAGDDPGERIARPPPRHIVAFGSTFAFL